MQWEGGRQSDNVEDRRDGGGGLGGGGRRIGGRGVGPGTVATALVAGRIFGTNPRTVLGLLGGEGGGISAPAPQVPQQGDVRAALNPAAQIGDDTLQARSGHIRPETFTHGTSAQRVAWFQRGIGSGCMADCHTFDARKL